MTPISKQFSKFMVLLALLSCIAGCGTTAKFVYPPGKGDVTTVSSQNQISKTVAVRPFREDRSGENSFSPFFLYMVPLSPYGYLEYSRPEAATKFLTIRQMDWNVREDLAKAAATNLRRSGLFDDAYFTFGGNTKEADYVLEGTVYSTLYTGTMYSYGLSILGPNLWFFGLPAGSSKDVLSIGLKLKDTETGKIIWENTFTKEKKIIQGYYYNWGDDIKAYSQLMLAIMNETTLDLAQRLPVQR